MILKMLSEWNVMVCSRLFYKVVPRLLGFLAIYTMTILLILEYGNPQWSRWIYIYQASSSYNVDRIIHRPSGYTGRWRAWYPNGKLRMECFFKDGRFHGAIRQWNEKGQETFSGMFINGRVVSGKNIPPAAPGSQPDTQPTE